MNAMTYRNLTAGALLLLVSIQIVTFYNSFTSHGRALQIDASNSMKHRVLSQCLFSTPRFAGIHVYSQNDEDGILLHILRCMGGHGRKEYFEFGAADGEVRNTRILRDHYGWKGHLLDGGNEKPEIQLHKEWFTPTNIVELMEKYKVSKTLDVLSIDTDCDDFWVTREVLHAGFRPRVLINEYNANIPSHLPLTVLPKEIGRESEEFCKGCYFGSGSLALNKLARAYGYTLVHSNHVNLFFVQNHLALNLGLSLPSFNDVVPPLEKKINSGLVGKQCATQDGVPMRNQWAWIDDKAIAQCHHDQIDHATLKKLMSNSTATFDLTESNDYRFFSNREFHS